jgi:hypothetical protein
MLMVNLLELSLKMSLALAKTIDCEILFVKYPCYNLLSTSALSAHILDVAQYGAE